MSPVDEAAQDLWDEYTKYKEAMFAKTNIPTAPWIIIQANKKTEARVEVTEHILCTIPYTDKGEVVFHDSNATPQAT